MTRVSGQHPDRDLLADLAAAVLPEEQAQALEEHVRSCSDCTKVLADAERVRSLLLAHDPGPMPDDVWARLESAIMAAADLPADGVHAVPDGVHPAMAIEPIPEVVRRPARQGVTGSWTETDLVPIRPHTPRGSRLGRPSRNSLRTRRQVREETQSARPSRRSVLLAVAAAIVVVAGAGVVVIPRLLPGGGSAGTSVAGYESAGGGRVSGAAAPAVPALGVLATGHDYTKATIVAQVRGLLGSSLARGDASSSTPAASSGAVGSGVAPKDTAQLPTPARASVPQAQASGGLTDPAVLAQCLKQLDTQGPALAVDLARWQGQEAAVIVVPSQSGTGGYEVWVVARSCRAGADGTLYWASISP